MEVMSKVPERRILACFAVDEVKETIEVRRWRLNQKWMSVLVCREVIKCNK